MRKKYILEIFDYTDNRKTAGRHYHDLRNGEQNEKEQNRSAPAEPGRAYAGN